ncbi:MAG: hypothetical protein IPP77_01170 [Bacteroidetes bacterium]|nr:hypothetical protein [Bacteroidota bacterium]
MKHLNLNFNQRENYLFPQFFIKKGRALLLSLSALICILYVNGQIVSEVSGGNWSATTTWVGGVVPTSTDNVVIVNGSLVTVDNTAATCANLTVGQGSSGKLTYIGGTTAATLTVNGDMTIATGGVLDAGVGTGTNSKKLNLGGNTNAGNLAGNLVINGTLDMGTTSEPATSAPSGLITFFGANNAMVSGTPILCRFNAIAVNKGTSSLSQVDVQVVFSMRAPGNTGGTPRLIITSGTFKISSASTITPYYSSEIICATAGRLWLNNAGASIGSVGGSTNAVTVLGELKIDAGSFNYGTGGDIFTVNGTLSIGGGSLSINGRVIFGNTSVFNMTAGSFNLDPQNTVNLSGSSHIIQFGTIVGGTPNVAFTGGTMTIVNPHSSSSTTGIAFMVMATSGTYNVAGSTIRFGDGVSTKSGSLDGFEINTASAALGNVIVNNTPSNPTNRFVRLSGNSTIAGTLTINNAQSEFKLTGYTLNLKGAFLNNGTFTGNELNSHLILSSTNAQTFTVGNYTGSSLTQLTINNGSGVTLGGALNTGILNMTLGKLYTTSANLISVTGTTAASITGGSSGSFVNGPYFQIATYRSNNRIHLLFSSR